MKKYAIFVEVSRREVHEVEADSPEDARAEFYAGRADRTETEDFYTVIEEILEEQ